MSSLSDWLEDLWDEDEPEPRREDSAPGEYPVEALPEVVREFVEAEAEAKGAPVEYVAVPAIVVLATAIGNSRALELKPGWVEGARFFAAVVGRPGTAKTPSQQAALEPLERVQMEEYQRYQAQVATQESDAEAPVLRQILLKDATMEAVIQELHRNPRGLLVARNELTAWVRSMDAYRGSRGMDRKAWMELWDGQMLTKTRATNQPLIVGRPLANVIGSLTPSDVSEIVSRSQDGFAERFLIAFPPNATVFPAVSLDDEELSHRYRYGELVETLLALRPESERGGVMVPRLVRLAPLAKQVLEAWLNEVRQDASAAEFPEYLISPWSKLRTYAARLALVIHMCRYVTGETLMEDVDADSVRRAIEVVKYHQGQARRIYGYVFATSEDRRLAQFRDWARRHGGQVTVRQAQRSNVAGVRSRDDALALFKRACQRGLGEVSKEGNSIIFTLSPRHT